MRYLSTQGRHETDLVGAMLQGLAPDGSLYVPADLPRFDAADIRGETVAEIGTELLAPFFVDSTLADSLEAICHDALNFPIPLETLAVVAYKQPVTLPEIKAIRGVDAAGAVHTLLEKGLLVTAGRKQVIGRPILYRTSKEFLLRFGLRDLSELPTLEEFQELARASLEGMEETAGVGGAAETTPAEPEGAGDGSAEAEAASSDPSGAAKAGHA